MGKSWQGLLPIYSDSCNHVICIISDHTDNLFCDSSVICDAHKLNCKDFCHVGIINLNDVKDRRIKLPTAQQELTSDRNIPLSALGSPQVSCQSTLFGHSKFNLELLVDCLGLVRKEASPDCTMARKLTLWVYDSRKVQEPSVFNEQVQLQVS